MATAQHLPNDLTEILRGWSDGDDDALEILMPIVYGELRRQAANYVYRENADLSMQATELIHEAYIKLIDQKRVKWQNRAHFFAIAAQAMRRILVDHARSKKREKRGGAAVDLPLDAAENVPEIASNVDLVALDEALTRLSKMDIQKGRIVELRYFSGLSVAETAEVMGISQKTVERNWTIAKAWLFRELNS